ncbi:MAG: hypothetical protein ACRC20_01785 [Segniliparus sp.]|uniref:hypothetical protein n=1 Tax=Segniliparus sp. TaxID=2804064 RepID=UPI003F352A05
MRNVTSKGGFVFWLSDDPTKTAQQIRINLDALGSIDDEFGTQDLAFSIYRVPVGTEYDEFPHTEEWIQAAGTAQSLTVEVKKRDEDGVCRLYTIGRLNAAAEPSESETITVGRNTTKVRPAEVLTAQDAVDLFQHYHAHNTVPEEWHLRLQPEFSDDLVAAQLAQEQAETAATASVSNDTQTSPGAVVDQASAAAPSKYAQSEQHEDQQHRADGA